MRSKLAKPSSSRSNGFFANSSKLSDNESHEKLNANKSEDEMEVDNIADHVVGQNIKNVLSGKSTSSGTNLNKPLPLTIRPTVKFSKQLKDEDSDRNKNNKEKNSSLSLSSKQIAEFIATVIAESNQGDYAYREIAWVYLNLIKKNGFIKGMNNSAAFKGKSIWYKAYLTELGFDDYKNDKINSRYMTITGGQRAKTIGEYVQKNGYWNSVSVKKIKKMKSFIENDVLPNQDKNPLKGFTGQGYWMDLNNYKQKGDHWHQVRHYYWLMKEGKVSGKYMKIVGSGNGTTFLFDRKNIIKYFKENPEMLPTDRSKIPDIDPSQKNMKMKEETSKSTRKNYNTYGS